MLLVIDFKVNNNSNTFENKIMLLAILLKINNNINTF